MNVLINLERYVIGIKMNDNEISETKEKNQMRREGIHRLLCKSNKNK